MGSGTFSSIRLLVAGASWRLFGSARAGEILLKAMANGNEQNRMLAGISLVKAGRRSLDLIENKIAAGEATAPVIRLLPDIGGEQARRLLEKIAAGEPGGEADAATECLALLDRIKNL